jgi:hypothetical protein
MIAGQETAGPNLAETWQPHWHHPSGRFAKRQLDESAATSSGSIGWTRKPDGIGAACAMDDGSDSFDSRIDSLCSV